MQDPPVPRPFPNNLVNFNEGPTIYNLRAKCEQRAARAQRRRGVISTPRSLSHARVRQAGRRRGLSAALSGLTPPSPPAPAAPAQAVRGAPPRAGVVREGGGDIPRRVRLPVGAGPEPVCARADGGAAVVHGRGRAGAVGVPPQHLPGRGGCARAPPCGLSIPPSPMGGEFDPLSHPLRTLTATEPSLAPPRAAEPLQWRPYGCKYRRIKCGRPRAPSGPACPRPLPSANTLTLGAAPPAQGLGAAAVRGERRADAAERGVDDGASVRAHAGPHGPGAGASSLACSPYCISTEVIRRTPTPARAAEPAGAPARRTGATTTGRSG